MNTCEDTACRIWPGFPAKVTQYHPTERSTYVIDSLRAGGDYRITQPAESMLNRETNPVGPDVRARVTTMLINKRNSGEEWPTVDRALLEEAAGAENLTPETRADRLLCFMRSAINGDMLPVPLFAPDVRPAALAHSESITVEELKQLVKHLESRGLVELPSTESGGNTPVITVNGIQHIRAITNQERSQIGFNTA